MRNIILSIIIAALVTAEQTAAAGNLEFASENFPRFAFFRYMESIPNNNRWSYSKWEDAFSRAQGIIGKTETEEVSERDNVLDWFTRYKKKYPNKFALIHFNGLSRLPTYERTPFFAGHWLYYDGSIALSDIPAKTGTTVIKVKDASRFKMDCGAENGILPDDICLAALDSKGKINWYYSEHCQLAGVNLKNNTITVKRAQYGSKPKAFEKNKFYIAPHATTGPWGLKNKRLLLWAYNYSTVCPKDKNGRNCIDVLAEQLSANFKANGKWKDLDGIQFDVIPSEPYYEANVSHEAANQLADCNGDMLPDDGIINGINTFGIGNDLFLYNLRKKVSSKYLILADGNGWETQRTSGILSGAELEGFPNNNPINFAKWSQGLNQLNFWETANHTISPRINYIAQKLKPDSSGSIPFRYYRLTIAASCFTDTGVMSYNWDKSKDPDAPPIYDEVCMGANNKIGWLGKPLRETVHLAESSPDLLKGTGNKISNKILEHIKSNKCQMSVLNGDLVVKSPTTHKNIRLVISDLPYTGPGLFISMTAHADPIEKYPKNYIRYFRCGISGDGKRSTLNMTQPIHTSDVGYRFYFQNTFDPVSNKKITFANNKTVSAVLEFEGTTPIHIKKITVHKAPEIVYREFERGVVIANLSEEKFSFDLTKHFRTRSFVRLTAQKGHDSKVNNGKLVTKSVIIPPKDALFLVKR